MVSYQPTTTELASFCRGMWEMYHFARRSSPDLVVFPLRGAYPFHVCYETIAGLQQELIPDSILLPLGTFTNIHTQTERGLTKEEKRRVIHLDLEDYFAAHAPARKVLLVDEVMHGGTILAHASLLRRFLQESRSDAELAVCAIEHGQRKQSGRYRNQAQKHFFHRVRVDSLFVMDRSQYLPRVTRNGAFSVEINKGSLDGIVDSLEKSKPFR